MASALPQRGVLRVVPEPQLQQQLKAANDARVAAETSAQTQQADTGLAAHIRAQFEIFRNHRSNSASGWNERLLAALRAFNGQYDAAKLSEIKKFGGSEVYARIIAMKCRGASALLRDVYLAPDRPWGIDPPSDPKIPPEIETAIQTLVQAEMQGIQQNGGDPSIDVNSVRDRMTQLLEAARQAAKKKAAAQAKVSEDKIDTILVEGNFYKALADFLVDLPLFPFAIIKGPVVRIVPSVVWQGGKATTANVPKMFWTRVSPFDLFWTPGVAEIEDADMIERTRVTRADLNDLLDIPGYRKDEILAVLDEHGRGGLNDTWDGTDSERAVQENRENPVTNRSGLITCLEYHGHVQGRTLLDNNMMTAEQVPDPLRDYFIQAWLVGRRVIKVQISPSPRKRHPYFVTSFEKVPGTPVGNGLPDILSDIAEVCNASLRTLVNNLSISSGPQVVINSDRLANDEDAEDMYPWKRWNTTSDPLGNNSQVPISFFQPTSNANELLAVYQKFSDMADEISAIPKYLSGGSAGGAGRTAAGLSMLMGNASKILQTVAHNIDRDVVDPALTGLADMIMLTDTSGILTGEENIKVMGVNVAVQRETQRSRQLEFLTATANPIDAQILGTKGRAVVLRSVATGIGIPGQEIVPSEEALQAMQAQNEQQQQEAHAADNGGPPAHGSPGNGGANGNMGPKVAISGGVH